MSLPRHSCSKVAPLCSVLRQFFYWEIKYIKPLYIWRVFDLEMHVNKVHSQDELQLHGFPAAIDNVGDLSLLHNLISF